MPNTLAHFGAQVLLQRPLAPGVALRWLLMGAVVSDVPWILQRLVLAVAPTVDGVLLRSYFIIQSSLLFSALLALALATFAARYFRVALALCLGCVLHLTLDATETKRANGVQFLVPYDWTVVNWALYWPESLITYGMTAAGIVVVLHAGRRLLTEPLGLARMDTCRILALLALLISYFGLPWLVIDQPYAHDNHFMRSCLDIDNRDGNAIEADRARFTGTASGAVGTICSAATELKGRFPEGIVAVSLQGHFQNGNLVITDTHVHGRGWHRDVGSYLGLGVLLLAWVIPGVRELVRTWTDAKQRSANVDHERLAR